MKQFLNYAVYISLFIVALNFTSCQDEFEEINNGEELQAIMASSVAATLVKNTATKDGSFDNIVDGASCFEINFPYSVAVNGIQLTIASIEDLHLIEEIFDAIDSDEDFLDILFPITITTADFTEITINGIADLRELAAECTEGGTDDDIECIDFVYPITLFTFDVELEQTGSVVVESDKDLRRFFGGLEDTDLVSFDFPISLALYDDTVITVNTNEELVRAIENAKDACDEDDDDDYNDDDCDECSAERIKESLVACSPWKIIEFERNDNDLITDFRTANLFFDAEGGVLVKQNGMEYQGGYTLSGDKNNILLEITGLDLEELNVVWSLDEVYFDEDYKELELSTDDDSDLELKSFCDGNEGGNEEGEDPNTLREILKECSWVIRKVALQGEEVRRLLGFEFEFLPEGVATLSNGITTGEGTWEIGYNDDQVLSLLIEFGSEPAVNFQWPLRDLTNDRLKFEVEEINYELILQRDCDNGASDEDVSEIRNIMLGGEWTIASYVEGEMDNTTMFGGYSLNFMASSQVSVLEGGEAFGQGLWRVLRNSEERLKVYLNFGDNMPFDALTDDWDFVSITDGRVELKDIDEDGILTTLVLEK